MVVTMLVAGCGKEKTLTEQVRTEGRWVSACSGTAPAKQWTAEFTGGKFKAEEIAYTDAECRDIRLTRSVEGDFKLGAIRNRAGGGTDGDLTLQVTKETITPVAWNAVLELRIVYSTRTPRPVFQRNVTTTIPAATETPKPHHVLLVTDRDGGMRFPFPEPGRHGTPHLRLSADPAKVPVLRRR